MEQKTSGSAQKPEAAEKRAIVFASFGVSDAEARRLTLDATAEEIAGAFPGITVRQAYTSNFIRRRMEADGIPAPSVPEALDALAAEGYTRVLVQPSHISPGEEYEQKLLSLVPEYLGRFRDFRMGEPVFCRQGGVKPGSPVDSPNGEADDFAVGLDAVMECFPTEAGEHLVLLGHGSPHRHNPVYSLLQRTADERGLSVHIGVVEESDTPNFAMVMSRLEAHPGARILLAPLLLAGGVHATEDMAGSGEGSWRSRIEAAGFAVRTCLSGLGAFPSFRRLYIRKIRDSLGA